MMLTLWTYNPNGERRVIDTVSMDELLDKLAFWRPVFPKQPIFVEEFEGNNIFPVLKDGDFQGGS